jgi:hypothetical protein
LLASYPTTKLRNQPLLAVTANLIYLTHHTYLDDVSSMFLVNHVGSKWVERADLIETVTPVTALHSSFTKTSKYLSVFVHCLFLLMMFKEENLSSFFL